MDKYSRYKNMIAECRIPTPTKNGFFCPAVPINGSLHADNRDAYFCDQHYIFGRNRHCGTDICRPSDTAIYPVAPGMVYKDYTWDARSNDYFHLAIIIKHTAPDGSIFYGYYMHIRSCLDGRVRVMPGDAIGFVADPADRGDGVAYTSSTSMVPHLHFGINPKVLSRNWGISPKGTTPPQNGWVDPDDFIGNP